MNIIDYIPEGRENAVTRAQLVARTGLNDRRVRQLIEDTRNAGELILNEQRGAGYYRVGPGELDALQRQYNQDTARSMSILKRRKKIRWILKAAGRPV